MDEVVVWLGWFTGQCGWVVCGWNGCVVRMVYRTVWWCGWNGLWIGWCVDRMGYRVVAGSGR